MQRTPGDFLRILKALTDAGAEFIVVGGVCAVIHGAPVTTFDLDIVHRRDPENVARLIKALHSLKATYRSRPDTAITPSEEALCSKGHHLLITTAGALDVLGVIGDVLTYEELKPESDLIRINDMSILVQRLDSLIRVKEQTLRDKDRLVLPILIETMQQKLL